MKTSINNNTFTAILGAFLFAAFLFVATPVLAGYLTQDHRSVTPDSYRQYDFFAVSSSTAGAPVTYGTTTSATSTTATPQTDELGRIDYGYFIVAGADQASLFFQRTTGGGNTGTSTFNVQVTYDGSTWVDYNKLIKNVTNTNAQTLTRVSSVILTGTSTEMVSMDLETDSVYAVRCIVVEAVDGTHRCTGFAEF